MRRSLRRIVIISALVCCALPAGASVMVRVELEKLAKESDVVARATVKATEGRRTTDGKRIYTVVTLEISEPWKGEPPRTVEVQTPGGTFGDYAQLVHGAARFEPGEDVVVFLRKVPAKPDVRTVPRFRVAAMAQGKLTIRKDPTRGELAAPNLADLELVDRPGELPRPAGVVAPTAVPELKERVRAALR